MFLSASVIDYFLGFHLKVSILLLILYVHYICVTYVYVCHWRRCDAVDVGRRMYTCCSLPFTFSVDESAVWLSVVLDWTHKFQEVGASSLRSSKCSLFPLLVLSRCQYIFVESFFFSANWTDPDCSMTYIYSYTYSWRVASWNSGGRCANGRTGPT